MNEKTFCLALNETGIVGYRRYQKLLETGNWHDLVSSPEKILTSSLPGKIKQKMYASLNNIEQVREMERELYRQRHDIHFFRDIYNLFPGASDLPLVLTGNFPLNSWSDYSHHIAVIGTCQPSPRALEITRDIIAYLRRYNVLIISGLARGIDQAAHFSALQQKRHTLAFLPYGIQHLKSRFINIPGMYFLSEAPCRAKWSNKWAILRNRLIALFSEAVIIVQSRPGGGSFHTARYGIEYGKKVFAVDFQDDCYQGNKMLFTKKGITKIQCLSDLSDLINKPLYQKERLV